MRFTPVLLIALFLVSCAPQKPDVSAIRKAIEDYNQVLAKALVAGENEKMMAYYTDDAISMPSNGPMLKGKDQIRSNMEQMSKSGMKITAATFTTTEVDAVGDLAYEVGTYDMSFEFGKATKMDDNGKYLSLWKKQKDGSWKVYAEIWNSNKEIPVGK